MRITDIFDAVRDGTYSDFLKFYTGDPNLFNKYAGLGINEKDIYGAIPLKYAITVVKLPTEAAMPVYQYLIEHGSKIYEKDNFDKACIDYAKEYSWRNGLISLMEGQTGNLCTGLTEGEYEGAKG